MNNTIENLKKYNLWRRGDESIEQPDPKDIGIWIDEICEIAEKLERERDEARELLSKALVRGDLALSETKKAKEELFWSDYQDKREMQRELDEAREALRKAIRFVEAYEPHSQGAEADQNETLSIIRKVLEETK